ncbi:uncharacterized protein LY89DRAFT_440735 [Mollisia scopiformis]|uniref:Glutamine amidotransferase type-2 domain-containing protein n=1 Tax=Mollisia scopiformis TaxID=149040 RepID=A0A194XKL1_MOLSC|nr:uncharacterized protein LY89DRAFT_440735 [Mollisia scopiformis]KUJ20327.1 hypothetical protein LY89DRAFT_440735 [Mollisia scopiformis]
MCGIYASISTQIFRAPNELLKQLLCNRGPDHIGEAQARVDGKGGTSFWISLVSTVLALRGGHVTAQPFLDPSSNSALCWNGEAWKIGLDTISGNDGQAVFDLLIKASSDHVSAPDSTAAVLRVLRSISGPFAFVYLDTYHNQLFFGRDRLGRRSLLHRSDDDTNVQFSSIADTTSGPWQEVEADAVYRYSLDTVNSREKHKTSSYDPFQASFAAIHKHVWACGSEPCPSVTIGTFNRAIPAEDFVLDEQTASVQLLRYHLSESLKLRILNIPKPPEHDSTKPVSIAVLFSGGLDCTVLARMAHDILPLNEQIDLVNVAFENPRVVRAAQKAALLEDKPPKDSQGNQSTPMTTAEISVPSFSPFEACPDRETGWKAFRELQTVCPSRTWRFIAVSPPYKETLEYKDRIIQIIHPHNTEMDLSIAYALYFASRGLGTASTISRLEPEPYKTPARVLLSGLGADELFGGYTRHATAFNRTGFTGLLDELKLDVDRLGKRNLGRDDRVISSWAKEARFPYLDEALVKWAVECPVSQKCGFRINAQPSQQDSKLEPGKKILRLLAYELGMHSVAMEKKRAIQFGARTAKMEVGKTKGTTLIS